MLINRIEIKGLFGTFHYNIDFQNSSNPFIITGPNGYGKTTILTIIDSLAKGDFYYFFMLPFSSIDFYLYDNLCLKIVSTYEEMERPKGADSLMSLPRNVEFHLEQDGQLSRKVLFNEEQIKNVIFSTPLYRNRFGRFVDIRTDSFYKGIRQDNNFYEMFLNDVDQGVNALIMLLRPLETTFIEAQRILMETTSDKNNDSVHRTPYHYKIQEIGSKIKDNLRKEQYQYLRKAQEIDSKLIEQLLSSSDDLSEQDYVNLKNKLDEKIKELVSFNLLDEISIRDFSQANKKILSVYIKSLENKLASYDSLLDKLHLFDELISSLKFVNKKVNFNPSYGIRVHDTKDQPIDLTKLSSGEQNEIVMLYYMIFETPDNKILMIDEPEISLHVCWQDDFLDNLSRIAQIKKLQVIVATHSPNIIDGMWDDCYDLCEELIVDE